MKAISVWQPWASAIAQEGKHIETRSWRTNYRGPIAIHASRRRVLSEIRHYASRWNFCGALGVRMWEVDLESWLPFGEIIAVAELVECRPTESFTASEIDQVYFRGWDRESQYTWTERDLGDFSPGRFGWVFEDGIRLLDKPIPFRGAQGLFTLPENVSRMLEA